MDFYDENLYWSNCSSSSPRLGQRVMVKDAQGQIKVCIYEDHLTWTGFKKKYVNALGAPIAVVDPLWWCEIPKGPPVRIKS